MDEMERTAAVQRRIRRWGEDRFGPWCMSDPKERAMRLLEEALEFAQAIGVSEEMTQSLARHVYARPPGEPPQELAGVGVTLLAAAEATGCDAGSLINGEISRIESKSREHFAARQQHKADAGVALPPDTRIHEDEDLQGHEGPCRA